MKKVYLFYSPLNKEVVAICAMNKAQALDILIKLNKITCKIITDDYIYASDVKCEVGAIGTVTTHEQE